MEKLRSFFCFNTSTPSSTVFPTNTTVFTRLHSRFWHKAKDFAVVNAAAKRKGLVSLSKDKEMCEGYADIETMWKMIHSSCSKDDIHSDHSLIGIAMETARDLDI